jgi:hypothetical protein
MAWLQASTDARLRVSHDLQHYRPELVEPRVRELSMRVRNAAKDRWLSLFTGGRLSEQGPQRVAWPELRRQQCFDNGGPFLIERTAGDRLPGVLIPVRRIGRIALAAVQIRVHPRAVGAGDLLRDLVRAIPVPTAFVPQCLQGIGKTVRWRCLRN